MERVEAVIMEVFISVFREKFRNMDFRLDFLPGHPKEEGLLDY